MRSKDHILSIATGDPEIEPLKIVELEQLKLEVLLDIRDTLCRIAEAQKSAAACAFFKK